MTGPRRAPAFADEWTCTREQLVDALARIELHPVKVPGRPIPVVPAEDMADAILRQLPCWREVADAEFDAQALAIIRPAWEDRDRYPDTAAQVAALRALAGRRAAR